MSLSEEDAQLVMRYADGELAPLDRERFEARLSQEPLLEAELADLRRLEVMARTACPPEPGDFACRRLERTTSQRVLWFLGSACILLGTLSLLALFLLETLSNGAPALAAFPGPLFLAGFALLLLGVLRERLARRPFDPYRELKR